METATEAKEPPPPDISQLCAETFRTTAEYLEGELAGNNFHHDHLRLSSMRIIFYVGNVWLHIHTDTYLLN